MSLKETKFYFEKLFTNGWYKTPIHYAGEEFDSTGKSKWVNVVYNPRSARQSGVQSSRVEGSLAVICWASNDVDVMGIADDVILFMKANVNKDVYFLNGYRVEDHAWHKSNQAYVYLTFEVTSYLC